MDAPNTSLLLGWCPFATPIASPNCTPGRSGVKAVVLHVTQGSFASSLSWLINASSRVSAHFLVGRDGRIVQLVSIRDSAWGNGLIWDRSAARWRNSRGKLVTPRWTLLVPPVSPNRTTISIEAEGESKQPWTLAQRAAIIRVLQWIAQQTGLVYRPGETLIGHRDLDNIDRPHCPGPHVDFVSVAADANQAPEPVAVRRYTVLLGPARVRSAPTTQASQLRSLPVGRTVDVVRLVDGLRVQGNPRWAELADGGYVWAGLLAEVES